MRATDAVAPGTQADYLASVRRTKVEARQPTATEMPYIATEALPADLQSEESQR